MTIESWIPVLDELVIVYNNCQDDTAVIVERYAEKYPDKIKAFHYLPIVYPQGSQKYQQTPSDSYHSLVNYYNYALVCTTFKWAVKLDGDLIIPDDHIRERIRNAYKELSQDDQNRNIQPLAGVNIIDHKGKIYVASSSMYCGLHGDLTMFRVDKDAIYIKGDKVEYHDIRLRNCLPVMFGYYHLKFLKNDYGIGNYDFENNPNSFPLLSQTLDFLTAFEVYPSIGYFEYREATGYYIRPIEFEPA